MSNEKQRDRYEKEKDELAATYPVGTLVHVEANPLQGAYTTLEQPIEPEDEYVAVVTGHAIFTFPESIKQSLPETSLKEGPVIKVSTDPSEFESVDQLNDFVAPVAEIVPPDRIVGMFE